MTIVERRDVLHESHATRSRPAITLGSVPVGDTNSSFVQSQTLERRAFPGVIEHIHFNIRGGPAPRSLSQTAMMVISRSPDTSWT